MLNTKIKDIEKDEFIVGVAVAMAALCTCGLGIMLAEIVKNYRP